MKKGDDNFNSKFFLLLISSILIFVVAVSLISANSAGASIGSGGKTLVTGNVYYVATGEPVPEAEIILKCKDNNNLRRDKTKNPTTNSEGFYYAIFDQQFECDDNDLVTIVATKDEETGENDGRVDGKVLENLDVALGSPPIPDVPEFGTVVGILTALGAFGVFFLVRRK